MPTPEIEILPPPAARWPEQHDDVARLRHAMPDLVVRVAAADAARTDAGIVVVHAPPSVDPLEFADLCRQAMLPPGHAWTPPLAE